MNIAIQLGRALIACLCVLCSICASTQTQITGRIAGQVSDTHGAVIVGVGIAADNIATGERRSAATDQSGSFAISYLPPAEYRVTIMAPDFATATYNHVAVAGNATTTLNVKVDVAPANVHVEVNDAPPVIQTASPELATNLDVRTLTSVRCRRATFCNWLLSRRA